MKLHKSQRLQAKIKMGLQGPAGSGKTYSALLLAHGMADDWTKIVVIDSEHGSSNLYASLGPYYVLELDPPYSPEKYIEALKLAKEVSPQCVIIDSISHCWEYLLDFHSSLPGNSFSNWSKVTPRQNAFVNALLELDAHTIVTMRTKQDYVLNLRDGKHVPEKVGLKAIQRDGIEYELTITFDLDYKHFCNVSKDRTGIFSDKAEYQSFQLTANHGRLIQEWTLSGYSIKSDIMACTSLEDLRTLYYQIRPNSQEISDLFALQKNILQTKMMRNNGTTTNS